MLRLENIYRHHVTIIYTCSTSVAHGFDCDVAGDCDASPPEPCLCTFIRLRFGSYNACLETELEQTAQGPPQDDIEDYYRLRKLDLRDQLAAMGCAKSDTEVLNSQSYSVWCKCNAAPDWDRRT